MVTMFPLLLQLGTKKNLSMAILALVMYMYTVKIAPKKPVQCQLTNSPVY